jgi:glycosyltransferase involved in cell wall biosynthesis
MQKVMKISIITAVFNGAETIESTVKSVLSQKYKNIEYIIIDGGSTDGTLEKLNKFKDDISCVISEKDDGIFYAMNKGIKQARGEIIGILNSDDFYINDEVISDVAEVLQSATTQGVYGDLLYVDRKNLLKTIRYWKAGTYTRSSFRWGWMPPHPTVFLRKEVYEKFGLFNTAFQSAADYEFLLRIMYRYNISLHYLPKVLVKMRVGGKSNLSMGNRLKANIEDLKAWEINGLNPYMFTTILKPLIKLKQYWQRPVNS